jgi:transitional endoplasmic reticulum ATPase
MRAAAGEGGVSFVTAKLSDILGKYEGESEQNVRNLFETARRNSPCILFFDEIDALGISREDGISASDKKMVNQLLTEMDGIGGGSEGILIVGATNIPWKVDIALRRSGRLGDAIYIPAPDAASREALFKISTKGKPLAKDVDFKKLAAMTEGYVSADLADICDRVFYGVYQEAMETGEEKAADMARFVAEIRKKKPTVKAWYQIAEKELENAPDRDIFEDVFNDIERFRELEQKKRGEGR